MTSTTRKMPTYRKVTKGRHDHAAVHINGRNYPLGKFDSPESHEKFHRLVAEWFASGCSKSFGKPERKLVIGELVDDYIHYCENYYGAGPNSELYRCNFEASWVKVLCDLYGTLPAVDFSPREYKAVRHQLQQRDLARSTINSSMKRLARMFKWAASECILPPAIYETLRLVPGLRFGHAREAEPVKPVDDALVEATLPYLSPVLADMVRVHLLTGMRPGELVIMRPCDIDRGGEVWEYRPQQHKTLYRGNDRVVAIGPLAQVVLARYLLRDSDSYCFSPRETVAAMRAELRATRVTPLSCGNRPGTNRKRRPKKKPGEHYSTRSYHQAVAKACNKAFPLPPEMIDDFEATAKWQAEHRWRPNQLRHAAATKIRRQFGLEAAQVVLGHSRADVTQIYAERNSALASQIARQVG